MRKNAVYSGLCEKESITQQDFCDGSFIEKVPSLGQMRLIYSVDI